MAITSEMAKKYGRKSSRKGIKNKIDSDVRASFESLVKDKLPELSQWLDKVAAKSPEKALNIILKMSEYILPKLQRIDLISEAEEFNEPQIDLNKLSISALKELKSAYIYPERFDEG